MKSKIKVGSKCKIRIIRAKTNAVSKTVENEVGLVLAVYKRFVLLGVGKIRTCAFASDIINGEVIVI